MKRIQRPKRWRALINPVGMTLSGLLLVMCWWVMKQKLVPPKVFGEVLAPVVESVGYGFFGSRWFVIIVLPLVWMAILGEWRLYFRHNNNGREPQRKKHEAKASHPAGSNRPRVLDKHPDNQSGHYPKTQS